MRVALVLEQLLSRVPGGTGRYARELASALAAIAPEGAELTGWVGAHGDFAAARVPGVAGPTRLALGHRALAVAWERGVGPAPRDADVIHAPTLLMPPRRRTPVVVTIHDAVPWTHPDTLTARGVAFHKRMGARAAAQADRVIVPSQATAAALAQVLDFGDRVHVIPLGMSLTIAAPTDARARRRQLGLPECYLVTVATLEPRKGLDVLLDAIGDVPDITLAVVGPDGWGNFDVATEVRDRALGDRVLHLRELSDSDLGAVVSGALALVQPSREEGFGLPVLEAMALGTPAVISDAPALVELAGGAAAVTAVGDPAALARELTALAGDPERAAQLGEAGRKRAAGFTWANAAEQTWAVYRAAATGERNGAPPAWQSSGPGGN
jgi:glycosyltransferase involved in cell wall biosynthesis